MNILRLFHSVLVQLPNSKKTLELCDGDKNEKAYQTYIPLQSIFPYQNWSEREHCEEIPQLRICRSHAQLSNHHVLFFMNPLLNLMVLATTSVRATENFCWVFLSLDVVICGVILVTSEAHLELSDWHFRCFISYPGNNSVKTIQPYSHVVQWGFLQQACVSCVFLSFEHFEVRNFLCPSRLTANTGNITRI